MALDSTNPPTILASCFSSEHPILSLNSMSDILLNKLPFILPGVLIPNKVSVRSFIKEDKLMPLFFLMSFIARLLAITLVSLLDII